MCVVAGILFAVPTILWFGPVRPVLCDFVLSRDGWTAPSIQGMSLADARALVEDSPCVTITVGEERPCGDVPPGSIVEPIGQLQTYEREIPVVVSKRPTREERRRSQVPHEEARRYVPPDLIDLEIVSAARTCTQELEIILEKPSGEPVTLRFRE